MVCIDLCEVKEQARISAGDDVERADEFGVEEVESMLKWRSDVQPQNKNR